MKNKKSEINWFWVALLVAVIAIIAGTFILIRAQGGIEVAMQKLGGLKYG